MHHIFGLFPFPFLFPCFPVAQQIIITTVVNISVKKKGSNSQVCLMLDDVNGIYKIHGQNAASKPQAIVSVLISEESSGVAKPGRQRPLLNIISLIPSLVAGL